MSDDTQPRLCFSYLRFSRSEQSKGTSTKRQTDLREAYCARRNLILDNSRQYEDLGVSAYNGKNLVEGHLASFLALVKAGSIPHGSVLLIESIDRFSRDQIRSARDRLESILEAGVEIHTLSPERIYDKESLKDPYALIGMILEFSRAHDYSAQLGRRIKAAWASKHDKARTSQVPLSNRPPEWLKVVNGKYQVIPERAKVVELIYQLCADGLGHRLISKELTRRGVPSLTGGKWTAPYITKILVSEAAIGHHHPRRIDSETRKKIATPKIENLYPRVIGETLYAQAKVAMSQRRKTGGRVNWDSGVIHPLSGLLRCHDGSSLHINYRKVGGKNDLKKNVAYVQDGGNGNSYPLSTLEFLVLGWLCKWEPEPVLQQNSETIELQEKLSQLEYRIQVLKDKVNAGEDFTSFLELLATAERDHKATSERLQTLRALTPTSQGLTTIQGIFERLGDVQDDHTTRENNLALRSALRRMVSLVEVTIGTENRYWPKKSLSVTVHFRDGSKADFRHGV